MQQYFEGFVMNDRFLPLFHEACQLQLNMQEGEDVILVLDAFYKCINSTQSNNLKGRVYFEMGSLFLAMSHLEKSFVTEALDCFHKASKLFSNNEDIARAYIEIGCITKSLKYIRDALSLFDEPDDHIDTFLIMLSLERSEQALSNKPATPFIRSCL